MKLIIGLGNPGKEYEDTRHNFGFMAVLDFYASHRDAFSNWKEKFNALISEGTIGNEKVVLILPQTFMNKSGEAVGALARYFKITPSGFGKLFRRGKNDLSNIWVIHDDIDLPLGITRLSRDAASGGHKGVESIIKHLGGKNFTRFRLGINSPFPKGSERDFSPFPKGSERDFSPFPKGSTLQGEGFKKGGINPPPAGTSFKKGGIISTEHFVLGKFSEEEKKLVENALHKTTNAIDGALQIGVERVMNAYNR